MSLKLGKHLNFNIFFIICSSYIICIKQIFDKKKFFRLAYLKLKP